MGVDFVYIVEFNDAFSRVSPQNFVTGILVPLQVHTAVVGFDFRYGYRGEGHAGMLRELSDNVLDVSTVPPFLIDGEKVSSSGIRKALPGRRHPLGQPLARTKLFAEGRGHARGKAGEIARLSDSQPGSSPSIT